MIIVLVLVKSKIIKFQVLLQNSESIEVKVNSLKKKTHEMVRPMDGAAVAIVSSLPVGACDNFNC